jgi:3-oxoacyl-[acyl-carrier protein] reductase
MKRALVTGGSGAIGAAICNRLAGDGFHVMVHANAGLERANTVVTNIIRHGGSAEAICFDVTDACAAQKSLEKTLEAEPIQVLVNNAGIHEDVTMAGMSVEQWRRVIDVSLHGFFNVTQPLLLPMLRTRWGRIISVSSVAAVLGNRGQTNYAAAKAGLHGATKSLAIEVASRGVTVNVIAPGIIRTAMTEDVFSDEEIVRMVPLQRAGTPEEVAHLAGFLASPEAAYITGQVISINGGMA